MVRIIRRRAQKACAISVATSGLEARQLDRRGNSPEVADVSFLCRKVPPQRRKQALELRATSR
jgi:hypothetical protein